MGSIQEGEIRLCPDHSHYQTPLIWTFAFSGAEYWCPHCGKTFGMMYGNQNVVLRTEELNRREKAFDEKTKEFLDALSARDCDSLMWEGKRIPPEELPQAEKDRIERVIRSYRYKSVV